MLQVLLILLFWIFPVSSNSVQIPVKKFTDGVLQWQLAQLGVFDRGEARFFIDECHRRSRKTTLAINLLIKEAAKNPNKAYVYVAPTYTAAKKIVWLDPNMLFSYLPDQKEYAWEKNESELFIKFPNGSILHILGGDKPDSLRGIDAQGVVFDEWDQMKEEIWTEIFYPIMNPDPTRWAMFIYTPKGHHAPAMFDKKACITTSVDLPVNGPTKRHKPDWHCVRLDAEHSGIIPLKELRKGQDEQPAHLYDQEMRCARVTEEERSLITSRLMESLMAVFTPPSETKKIISCDPSEGKDECPIYVFEDTEVIDEEILREPEIRGNIMVISGYIKNMAKEHVCNSMILDANQLGKGVADDLARNPDFDVQQFKGGRKSSDPERWRNMNMEMVYYLSREMRKGRIAPIKDAETRRQLVGASKFQIGTWNDVMSLDLAAKIREVLGCSPDRAKAYMMGIWGLQFVEGDLASGDTDYDKRSSPTRPVEAA